MGKRTGNVIRMIRGPRSMRELAAELGVQESTVSKWESGANRPNGRNLGKLLRAAKDPRQSVALLEAVDEDVPHLEDHILEAGGVKVVRR